MMEVEAAAGAEKPSDQGEIDQREKSGAGRRHHQGMIGADVQTRAGQGSMGFLSHFQDLGQGAEALCEADHIRMIFFRARSLGTSWQRWNYRSSGFRRLDRVERL